jgi:hypothetical protein
MLLLLRLHRLQKRYAKLKIISADYEAALHFSSYDIDNWQGFASFGKCTHIIELTALAKHSCARAEKFLKKCESLQDTHKVFCFDQQESLLKKLNYYCKVISKISYHIKLMPNCLSLLNYCRKVHFTIITKVLFY